MMNNWKFIGLQIAGEKMEFIYDCKEDKVYPKLFPGLEIQPFTSRCGMRIMPEILKQIVVDKISLLELEMQKALKEQNFSDLF
jgi:hypothetical protein